MASITFLQLLRGNRSFRRLWAGQVVSELGTWFNFIATLGLVRFVSSASSGAAAIILVARLLPFSVFSPFAGAFADRWSRRHVMIAADVARAVFALGFLLVRGPRDLWIAYSCTIAASLLTAFFEAAKNAAMPNITGNDGLLAGNTLMFSSRFLLMSIGAGLGGATSARFGYVAAFIVNSASFLVSAYSISLIPESDVQAGERTSTERRSGNAAVRKSSYWTEIREGWKFIKSNRLVAALIGCNVIWATGGGAFYLVFERLGGVVFAPKAGYSPDAAVAVLYTTSGLGLFIGMMFARRVGAHVELHNWTAPYIGWMLVLHGIVFAACGLAPTLGIAALLIFVSRVVIGAEFGVQDTLLVRIIPDSLRGRVVTTDRAAEILLMSCSTSVAGLGLRWISISTLTIISGLLAASPGAIWLWLFRHGWLDARVVNSANSSSSSDLATGV